MSSPGPGPRGRPGGRSGEGAVALTRPLPMHVGSPRGPQCVLSSCTCPRACWPPLLVSSFPAGSTLWRGGCAHGPRVGAQWPCRLGPVTLMESSEARHWGGASLPADGPTSRWRVVLGGALLSRSPGSGGHLGVPDVQCSLPLLPGRLRAGGRGILLPPQARCVCAGGPHMPGDPGTQKPGSVQVLLPPEHLPGSQWGLWGGACPCPPPSNCRGPAGGHGSLGGTAEWGLEAQGPCLGRHPPAGEVPGVPPGELT